MKLLRKDFIDVIEPARHILEEVCEINQFDKFSIEPAFGDNEDDFYSWNLFLYKNGEKILLESYDDEDDATGAEIAINVINSIKEGFLLGVEGYVIPENNN